MLVLNVGRRIVSLGIVHVHSVVWLRSLIH